jgi:glycine/D-amino acid oxidase-like deaminating enzyme
VEALDDLVQPLAELARNGALLLRHGGWGSPPAAALALAVAAAERSASAILPQAYYRVTLKN